MNIKIELLNFKKKLDPKLASFLNFKISKVKKIDPKAAFIVEQIKDLTLRGGKRLRPGFLYYGFKACGGKDEEAIFPYCLAVELFHSMALIHDDIIDNSDLRRGGPTIHKVLGIPGAILAGDLCFSWAEEVFLRRARKYWDLLKEEVILGQYLETTLSSQEFFKKDPRSREDFKELEKEVLKVLEYKTARYSIVRPLQTGAFLAGAKEKELKILENYGLPLGIAFQIVDDILGMFGEEKIIGKPADSDLKEGKITLLIIKSIEKIKNKKLKTQIKNKKFKEKKLLSLLGNREATREDLEWVRNLIKETGSLSYSQKKAQSLVKKAKRVIKDYPFEKEAKEFLLGIADFVIARKY